MISVLSRNKIAEACGASTQVVSHWYKIGLARNTRPEALIDWLESNERDEYAERARTHFGIAETSSQGGQSASVRLTEAKIRSEQEKYRTLRFANDEREAELVSTAVAREAVDKLIADVKAYFLGFATAITPSLEYKPAHEIVSTLSVGLEDAITRFGKGDR